MASIEVVTGQTAPEASHRLLRRRRFGPRATTARGSFPSSLRSFRSRGRWGKKNVANTDCTVIELSSSWCSAFPCQSFTHLIPTTPTGFNQSIQTCWSTIPVLQPEKPRPPRNAHSWPSPQAKGLQGSAPTQQPVIARLCTVRSRDRAVWSAGSQCARAKGEVGRVHPAHSCVVPAAISRTAAATTPGWESRRLGKRFGPGQGKGL